MRTFACSIQVQATLSGVCMYLDPNGSCCGAVKIREVNFQKVSDELLKAVRLFGECYFKLMLCLFSSVVG